MMLRRVFPCLLVLSACGSDLPLPVVRITPERPITTDTLEAEVELSDALEGVEIAYHWTVDDVDAPLAPGATVDPSLTARGDLWRVEVVISKGSRSTEPVGAETEIRNAIPEVSVALPPDPIYAGTAITAITTATDADDDELTYTYKWVRNGKIAADLTTDTLPEGRTRAGEVWEVDVVAHDGLQSSATATATATIGFAVPVIDSFTWAPDPPNRREPTTTTYQAHNPDGGALEVAYAWSIAGQVDPTLTGPDVPAGRFTRGQQVGVTLSVTNDNDLTAEQTLSATVGNAPPTLDGVQITPLVPDVTSNVQCADQGRDDADGDAVVVGWAWEADGVLVSGATAKSLVPASKNLLRGQRLRCVATPADGFKPTADPVRSTEVILDNAAPAILSAEIVRPVNDFAPVTVNITSSDPDGDPVAYTYAWTRNGTPAGSEATLAQSKYARGEVVSVKVTPIDVPPSPYLARVGPQVEATGSFTAPNRPPQIEDLAFTPNPPTADGDLTVSGTVADPDGDPMVVSWVWKVNGVIDASVTGPVFPAAKLKRDQAIQVSVTASDHTDQVGPVTLSTLVANALPVIDTLQYEVGGNVSSVPHVTESTPVTCKVVAAHDADSDNILYAYRWLITKPDGSTLTRQTEVIDGNSFSRGDTVQCMATPNDSYGSGAPVSAQTFTVGNAPPVLGNVSITPNPAYVGSTLRASLSGWSDPDGDDVTYTWSWVVGDTLAGSGDQLFPGVFSRGQKVSALANASDGHGGTSTSSASLTIQNSAPVLLNAQLQPTNPRASNDIVLALSTADADGDEVTATVTWRVSGAVVAGVTGTTLSAGRFAKGQTVTASVVISDGTATLAPQNVPGVTVVDSPPSDPVVSVYPRWVRGGSTDLLCEIAIPAVDPDTGDSVTYDMKWMRNGVLYTGGGGKPAPSTRKWPGDLLLKEAIDQGESWTCVATAISSGSARGTEVQALARSADFDYASLALGGSHACGILPNGKIQCWGGNNAGQAKPSTNYTYQSVDAGDFATCARDSGGSLRCYGVAALTTPITTPLSEYKLGSYHACGITSASGAVVCWGTNVSGSTQPPSGLTARHLDTGALHSCAVKSDASVVCWGDNTHGQIDVPTGRKWLSVAAGGEFSCGLTSEGKIQCWGGGPVVGYEPTGNNFVEVKAAAQYACGVRKDDSIVCWGDPNIPFTPPVSTGFARLHLGSAFVCGEYTDGALECWGDDAYAATVPGTTAFTEVALGPDHACAVETNGALTCWGANTSGQANAPALSFTPAQLAVADRFSCARGENGAVACWGRDNDRQISDVPPVSLFQIEAGGSHVCGRDGSGQLYCWGRNSVGQSTAPSGSGWTDIALSTSTSCGINSLSQVTCWGTDDYFVVSGVPTDFVTDIDVADTYGCAVTEQGKIQCWGSGVPTGVPTGTNFIEVSTARNYACGLTSTNQVQCWGDNSKGQRTAWVGAYQHIFVTRGSGSSSDMTTCGRRVIEQDIVCWGSMSRF